MPVRHRRGAVSHWIVGLASDAPHQVRMIWLPILECCGPQVDAVGSRVTEMGA